MKPSTGGKRLKTIVLILLNVILLTSGQLLWKMGLTREGGISLDNMLRVALSPFILAGLALYVVATVIWFIVLSRAELSYAYPLQSMAYIIGVVAAWLLFNETVPVIRWVGVFVIIVGVVLVSYSKPQEGTRVSGAAPKAYKAEVMVNGTGTERVQAGRFSEVPADTGDYGTEDYSTDDFGIKNKGENK